MEFCMFRQGQERKPQKSDVYVDCYESIFQSEKSIVSDFHNKNNGLQRGLNNWWIGTLTCINYRVRWNSREMFICLSISTADIEARLMTMKFLLRRFHTILLSFLSHRILLIESTRNDFYKINRLLSVLRFFLSRHQLTAVKIKIVQQDFIWEQKNFNEKSNFCDEKLAWIKFLKRRFKRFCLCWDTKLRTLKRSCRLLGKKENFRSSCCKHNK